MFDQALAKTIAALKAEGFGVLSDIGLLLPCNVIVREEAPEREVVGFLDPQIRVKLVGKSDVKTVADDAEQWLRRAYENR